jgi:hypothetical protein
VHDLQNGNSTCKKCEVSQQAMRGECTDLFKCSPGEYSENGYGPYCNSCPQGTYSQVAGTKKGECSLAPYGTYAENNGNVNPQECGSGQYTLSEGSDSKDACLECPSKNNMVANEQKSGCVVCADGEYASGGDCLKDLNQGSAIAGVFANEGTPFYVLVIVVLLIAMLSIVVHSSKEKDHALLQLPIGEHLGKFALGYAGVMSELILCAGVLSSGLSSVRIYGLLLLLSRIVVSVPPGAMLMYAIFCSSKLVDESTGEKTFKYYLDVDTVTKNTKTYMMVIVLGLFEPPLLAFLPWYESEFSVASGFPSLRLMRLCQFFKVLQLVVTLVAQVGLLMAQRGYTDNTAGTIIILNVTFTCVAASIKGFEMFLKSSVLMGAAKSDDSETAKTRSSFSATSSAGEGEGKATDGGGVSTIEYMSNPMMKGGALAEAEATCGGGGSDGAIYSAEKGEAENEGEAVPLLSRRLEAVEMTAARVQGMEEQIALLFSKIQYSSSSSSGQQPRHSLVTAQGSGAKRGSLKSASASSSEQMFVRRPSGAIERVHAPPLAPLVPATAAAADAAAARQKEGL